MTSRAADGIAGAEPAAWTRPSSPACTPITDTGPADALAELARDAGLLLAGATLADAGTSDWGHLCATDAARVAAAAGAGQLVLTHLGSAGPQWTQARKIDAAGLFTGLVHLARPGARYPVRQP